MNGRVLEAARSGSTETLLELLREDPSVLATFALSSRESLLHNASMFGHVDFAWQILQLQQSSALELNQDGYSAMHISSTHGNVEIVTMLLEFGRNHSILKEICVQRNIYGRSPFHCAVIKGKIHVMEVLLIACPESAYELTDQSETVLHLAVKNNQREAFWFLIQGQQIKQLLINSIDNEGNNILHLATARKQYQIISFLLKEASLNVNAVNSRGLTALDVLLTVPSESNDIELVEMLRSAGGKRSLDHQAPPMQGQITSNILGTISQRVDQNTTRGGDWVAEMRNGILMMASLTATMTFQAALAPPGGFWQDWSDNTTNNSTTLFNTTASAPPPRPEHKPGTVVIYDLNRKDFTSFLFWDSVGFLASLSIILSLIIPMPFKHDSTRWTFVRYSIYTVVVSVQIIFLEAVELTTNKKIYYQKSFIVFIVFLGLWLPIGLMALSDGFSRMKKRENNESDSD